MDTELVFRIIAGINLAIALSVSIFYRRRAAQSGEPISTQEEGPLLLNLRRILGLALWLSVFSYLVVPGWVAWAQLPLPVWIRLSGAALMVASLPSLYWVFSSLGNNVTPTVVIRKEHQYRDYMQRTGRFWPRLRARPLSGSAGG